ncbi:MAG TPA: hypothetical protein VKP69_11195, partial [Isosphaeraceae bacterium]|nr:hypothetical protein [Isosphaeraceae bacterium]
MRQDAPDTAPSSLDSSDSPAPARTHAWVGITVLVMLMVSTSLAVASFVSAWLVPPYLALMAAILFAPPGRRDSAVDRSAWPIMGAEPESDFGEDLAGPAGAELGAVRAVEPSSTGPNASADPTRGPSEASVAVSESSGAKVKRGKGKARGKSKARALAEPTDATWIRVGPGKFVRADAPTPGPTVEGTSPLSTIEPAPPPHASAFEAGAEERTDALSGRDAEAATMAEDRPEPESDGPPATVDEASLAFPISGEPTLAQDEASPPAAPEPVAAAERSSGREEVIPPGAPGSLVAVDATASPRHEAAPWDAPEPALAAGELAGPPAPIVDEPPPECAEASPWSVPEPGVPVDESSPLREEAAPEGAPEPDIAAVEPTAACEEVTPPGMLEPAGAVDGPEPAGGEVVSSSESGPVVPADEPTPARAEASPWDAPELGLSMVAEEPPEFAEPSDGPRRTEGGVEGRWPHVEGDQALENVGVAWVAAEVGNDAAAHRAEDPGPGPADEETEEIGIAPEASDLARLAEPEGPSPGGDGEGRLTPAQVPDRPARTTGTLLLSLRGAWRPNPHAARGGRNAPSPPGRGARSSRRTRVNPGLRHHARRESGRSRQARRTFPPRSPPAQARQSGRCRGELGATRARPAAFPVGFTKSTKAISN